MEDGSEVNEKTEHELVRKHLETIQKAVDHATAGVATSREITRGGVLVNRDNLIAVLQIIGRSRWACSDLLFHAGEPLAPAQGPEETYPAAAARPLIEALYRAMLWQEEVIQAAGDLLEERRRPDLNREWHAARGRITRPVQRARYLVRQYERDYNQGRYLLAEDANADVERQEEEEGA